MLLVAATLAAPGAGALAQPAARIVDADGGRLELHPENPHYILWRGKPTIVITSGEHYGAVLNLDFDYRRYLDTLARDGMNGTRTWVGTYVETAGNFNIAGNTLDPAPGRYIAPWARSTTPGYADGGNKFDLTKWDDAYFARLYDFLEYASRRAVIVELVLFCPLYEDSMWQVSPMNPRNNVNGFGVTARQDVLTLRRSGGLLAIQEALARRIVEHASRFDNVYIEICNEPYATGVPEDWQRHMASVVGDAIARHGGRLLVSQNVANHGLRIVDPHPAISIFNFHYATPPDTVGWNYHLNRVIGDNETGFRGTSDLAYRSEAWEFVLAGGGLYNNLDYSFTVGHEDGTFTFPDTQPGGGGPRLRRQLRVLSGLVHGFDFVRMKPDTSVIQAGVPAGGSAQALVEPGRSYIVYLRRHRASGPFSARWSGQLTAPLSGEYVLHTESNDGVRLSIDGRNLIEDWTDHSAKEDRAVVHLEAGRSYPVTLEYFYNGGQGVMKLSWTPPGGTQAPIPASALRAPDGTAPGLRGEYFEGIKFERAWFTRTDPQVSFAFGTSGPAPPEREKSTAAVQMNLPTGSWTIEWLDPVTGAIVSRTKLTHGGGTATLDTPRWEDDVAIVIRPATAPAP
jgi:PA14 domain